MHVDFFCSVYFFSYSFEFCFLCLFPYLDTGIYIIASSCTQNSLVKKWILWECLNIIDNICVDVFTITRTNINVEISIR